MNFRNTLFVILLVLTSLELSAQVAKDSELFQTLKAQDSIFFQEGFNNCNLDYLRDVIRSDMKFYHDQSGFQDRDTFFENVEKYICVGTGPKPVRKVSESSLEVFPLYNNGVLYGAIQKGIHNFYIREEGKEDRWTSTARFTSVWVLEDQKWTYADCLSYDHGLPETQ